MKIRTSFVSNSSSASFIVRWKFKPNKFDLTPKTLKDALKILFPYTDIHHGIVEFEEVKKNTKELFDGQVFETSFWTSMNNEEYRDFGDAACALIMTLIFQKDIFEFETDIIGK